MQRALALASLVLAAAADNDRPIIGVLTLPNDGVYAKSHGAQFFPASYVKWLEGGGARVVPIPYDGTPAETVALLKQINGALFTGGAAAFVNADGTLTQYAATAQLVFDEVVAAAAAGESWPLWGTCLGHELISVLGAGTLDVLTSGFNAENLTETVSWTPLAASSRLWGPRSDVRALYATQPIAMNAHTQGITPANFAANAKLSGSFDVLGTSVDRAGIQFIASMEHKQLPIFTTQWHSEKALYEWPAPWTEGIPHSRDAITANLAGALFFAEAARANYRAFASTADETAALIYNYSPITGISSMFMQIYFFPASH